jgi:peptidoglycan/LPS O-acetylase OafA/YrhL
MERTDLHVDDMKQSDLVAAREQEAGQRRQVKAATRLVELDALRGVAAMGVVLYHYTSIFPRLVAHRDFDHLPHLGFGYFGVELFFMISGFVIFFTAQRSKSIGDFAKSRFSRLFPAYWAAVAIAALVQLVIYNAPVAPLLQQTLVNLTMLQVFFGVEGLDGSYWTLAFELSFYVLIAIALRITSARGWRIDWALLCWLVAATVIRAGNLYIPYRIAVFGLLNYGQFFVFGVALYVIYSKKATALTYLVAGWALLMSTFGADPHTPAAGFDYYFLGAWGAAALMVLGLWLKPSILSSSLLQFLGKISYSLYLTHSTIGFVVIKKVMAHTDSDLLAVGLAVSAAILVGWLLNISIENPGRLALAKLLHHHRPNI